MLHCFRWVVRMRGCTRRSSRPLRRRFDGLVGRLWGVRGGGGRTLGCALPMLGVVSRRLRAFHPVPAYSACGYGWHHQRTFAFTSPFLDEGVIWHRPLLGSRFGGAAVLWRITSRLETRVAPGSVVLVRICCRTLSTHRLPTEAKFWWTVVSGGA